MKVLLAVILMHLGALTALAQYNPDDLVETLLRTAKPGTGISSDAQELAAKFHSLGPAAIPYLPPLLGSPNEPVRKLASFILRDMEGLKEKDLDALIECAQRGGDWILPAIAHVGGPRAIDFLVRELVRGRQTDNEATWSIAFLGERAVPQLLKVLDDEKTWNDALDRTMRSVFRRLGGKAASAVDPLLAIANDDARSTKQRIRAISLIDSIGAPAQRAGSDLAKLWENGDGGIRDAAISALVGIRAPEAGAILAGNLEKTQDPFRRRTLLRDIAELGVNAKSVGPTVVKYLADENWDVRVDAARALGYIGAEDSAGDLIRMLSSEKDWRLVWCAASSLGSLKSRQAIPALSKISAIHWYPPVREMALKSLDAIRSGNPMEAFYPFDDFAEEFISYQEAGLSLDTLEAGDEDHLRFAVAPLVVKDVTAMIQSNTALKEAGPFFGIEVPGGHLAGSDRGEWGGAIVFIDPQGKASVLMSENIQAIYKTDHAVLAVAAHTYLGLIEGAVYKVSKNADGIWEAKPWRMLPGAPHFSRMLKDGSLFVSCYGGIVRISPEGEIRALTRNESTDAPAPERP